MVVNISQSGEITVNRGVADNVTPGTRWYIYSNGKPKAELEAVLVDNYTTQAKVVSGSGVTVGDKATTKAFASSASLPAASASAQTAADGSEAQIGADGAALPGDIGADTAMNDSSAARRVPKNKQDKRFKDKPKERVENAETAEKSYNKLFSSCTKKVSFSGGVDNRSKTSINPMNAYNMFSTLTTTNIVTPQIIIPTIIDEYNYNKSSKESVKLCSLDVEVTWWSESLVDAYSDMMAFREGRTDMEQRMAMRGGLYSQKGVDKFVVFHVKMKNTGKSNVQVEPFNWHAYLVDDQGNRVKAERYDQVLDRVLAPDQETEGNVYFLKYDASGRNFSDRSVTLVLEDILAERATLKY
ncbi:hypothetical protein IJT93_09645 [bacterium]|nr:hypothetical protein [bacterium]